MHTEEQPYSDPIEKDFPNRQILFQCEGGIVWLAEKDGRFYVITDEGSMAGFLDPEEDEDMLSQLKNIHEFDTEADRERYIEKRGWSGFRQR